VTLEAYRETRLRQNPATILDDAAVDGTMDAGDPEIDWYLKRLDEALPTTDRGLWGEHPKIEATVHRAVELWKGGEKVVIFCLYIETGRALRRHVLRALEDEFVRLGAERLGLRADERKGLGGTAAPQRALLRSEVAYGGKWSGA
jgi:hypothetical protein